MQILEKSTTQLEQRAREYMAVEGLSGGLFLESSKRNVTKQSESTVDNDIEKGWELIDPSHL
ncbi:hypothetical protein EYZ11_013184 [Aspergillus tanneri]|nr:hypothetical protein EYZ11_013184 [Aspergillus tanneri]